MKYNVISADCHIDLIWLPPDLFTSNASAALKDRMPYVTDGEKGPTWVSNGGAQFGLQCGMGSAGREYVPGVIQRSDRMAETGLYEPEQRQLRRLTDPDLRLKDQDRDGVQAEVLYGILGASQRLQDPEAAVEVMRIYNEWLADFCAAHPERYAGLACIPNHDIPAAVAEIERVAKRGVVRGLEVANTFDMKPLYHPDWAPMWASANASKLPVHFHTVGSKGPNLDGLNAMQQRQAFAVQITGFQMGMSRILMEIIFGGVLEAYSDIKVVIGESGIGWIPYVLEHMDLEWEDQFTDLTLTMKPSEYWHRQCRATYQSDKVGIRLLDYLGEENIMWGSDYPHPDGVWPDSQSFIQSELGDLPAATQRKIVCENAASLYGFNAT
ncbi:MAG: amidohydrolase [Gammaproteobacteria bacterium]|nr:amidohydrolase [Gammaproteobacteria bacterium]